MAAYTVLTNGGDHTFLDSDFKITYHAVSESSNSVFVWESNDDTCFTLSILNSPSGSGKTTFISNVYRYVQNIPSSLSFDFRPDHVSHERCSYGYIPQHPPFGNHWKISDLLPDSPNFFKALFPGADEGEYLSKRLGQYSGGQKLKLYVCSALEQLYLTGQDAAFLVLDEVFDGLGATEAQRCIREIRATWNELSDKPLYVLLVSHLDQTKVVPDDVDVTRLSLAVEDESYSQKTVRVENRK